MSENQQLQQEQHASTSCKNKKAKNKRKPKELACGAGDVQLMAEKEPLHNSVEQMSHKSTTSNANRKAAGSNWEAVAKTNQQVKEMPYQQENMAAAKEEKKHSEIVTLTKSARQRQKRRAAENKYIAMDCEMVGVGPNGQDDMVARVSIVSKRGNVLMDKFVKPRETVTDYRTSVSGIRPHDIAQGEEFASVQEEVVQMLQDKILVGHAIRNDLAVLHIKHPSSSIRDTSHYKPLRRLVSNGYTPSLKRLAQAILGKEIQTGEHNSVEDARAAMSIYKVLAGDWEAYLKRHKQRGCK